MSIASLNLRLTPTLPNPNATPVVKTNHARLIPGFWCITEPYDDHEDWMLMKAIAELEKDGIAWRVGDNRCLYRAEAGVAPDSEVTL